MSNLRRPLTDAAASDDAPAADAATAFAAIQLNDFNDLDDDEADVRRRAYEMERRADEQWRSMHKEQRRRNEEAELKARPSAEQVASQAESRRQQALQQQAHERQQRALEEESSSSSVVRGDDETDASGWTPREQRGLQAALRTCPAKDFASAGARWQAVAAQLPGRTAKECLQRCKQLAAAVKAHRPSPLVRLEADVLLAVLERLGGFALCTVACVCKELRSAARDEVLWMQHPNSNPNPNPNPNPGPNPNQVPLHRPAAHSAPQLQDAQLQMQIQIHADAYLHHYGYGAAAAHRQPPPGAPPACGGHPGYHGHGHYAAPFVGRQMFPHAAPAAAPPAAPAAAYGGWPRASGVQGEPPTPPHEDGF